MGNKLSRRENKRGKHNVGGEKRENFQLAKERGRYHFFIEKKLQRLRKTDGFDLGLGKRKKERAPLIWMAEHESPRGGGKGKKLLARKRACSFPVSGKKRMSPALRAPRRKRKKGQ